MEKAASKLSKLMFLLFFIDIIVNSLTAFIFNDGVPMITSALTLGPFVMNFYLATITLTLGFFFWFFHRKLPPINEA